MSETSTIYNKEQPRFFYLIFDKYEYKFPWFYKNVSFYVKLVNTNQLNEEVNFIKEGKKRNKEKIKLFIVDMENKDDLSKLDLVEKCTQKLTNQLRKKEEISLFELKKYEKEIEEILGKKLRKL